MNQVNCPICGNKCVRSGKTKAGSQRWFFRACKTSLTHKIDNNSKDVLFLDGIYLGKKVCILICCDEKNVLGWYLCRYEHSGAWIALMRRIAEPRMVVSDGGSGFSKALKKVWPNAKHQRCMFHVFCQVKRYTTSRPTHERLLKAERSLIRLIKENTMFTYLDSELCKDFNPPSTNNMVEGGINARLREMLRNHRGLSIERRIKAVYWWCYTIGSLQNFLERSYCSKT